MSRYKKVIIPLLAAVAMVSFGFPSILVHVAIVLFFPAYALLLASIVLIGFALLATITVPVGRLILDLAEARTAKVLVHEEEQAEDRKAA